MICGIGKVDERDSDGISLAISCDGERSVQMDPDIRHISRPRVESCVPMGPRFGTGRVLERSGPSRITRLAPAELSWRLP